MSRVHADPIEKLRARTSAKWVQFPSDVLPLPVAEMDFPLAPAVASALHSAIDRSDTGYHFGSRDVADAFARFASARWGWSPDPARMTLTADVSMGIVEVLRQVTAAGDGVVICPPIYPPFFDLAPEAGRHIVTVPMLGGIDEGWSLDLEGIEQAFADGAASAIVISNPHNPVGRCWTADELRALADVAERHGATVVSDEIHGALVYPDAVFAPFLTVSDAAREVGVSVTSASKAFNLAGLKCALVVTAGERGDAARAAFPYEVEWRASILGAIASVAAFRDGDEWLDGVLETLDGNRRELGRMLAATLPGTRYRVPEATYLAWIDFSALGWGDDPAAYALEHARVALANGPGFGADEGRGHARLNFGTSPEIVGEAIARLGALVG